MLTSPSLVILNRCWRNCLPAMKQNTSMFTTPGAAALRRGSNASSLASRNLCYGVLRQSAREKPMAKYSRSAGKDVKRAMHKRKKGTLKSGKGGKGGKVKSRKQAIAIGLSEARKKGKKVPKKSSSKKRK